MAKGKGAKEQTLSIKHYTILKIEQHKSN